jgi:hypothetical protein
MFSQLRKREMLLKRLKVLIAPQLLRPTYVGKQTKREYGLQPTRVLTYSLTCEQRPNSSIPLPKLLAILRTSQRVLASLAIACEAPLAIGSPWPNTARSNVSFASFFTL